MNRLTKHAMQAWKFADRVSLMLRMHLPAPQLFFSDYHRCCCRWGTVACRPFSTWIPPPQVPQVPQVPQSTEHVVSTMRTLLQQRKYRSAYRVYERHLPILLATPTLPPSPTHPSTWSHYANEVRDAHTLGIWVLANISLDASQPQEAQVAQAHALLVRITDPGPNPNFNPSSPDNPDSPSSPSADYNPIPDANTRPCMQPRSVMTYAAFLTGAASLGMANLVADTLQRMESDPIIGTGSDGRRSRLIVEIVVRMHLALGDFEAAWAECSAAAATFETRTQHLVSEVLRAVVEALRDPARSPDQRQRLQTLLETIAKSQQSSEN
ncbi:putative mitochondrial protein [Andalucia godoyi]|uniref:Putative mitochondrial protein n=1 Tax=Andalucia godoyi TaxID=505711 RepID=A0A8K0AK52_ANDGO|nr:putative mitochondrial protein [Andalucia godoyi]|eukprot:ANDGO_05219.mRNA.1 putative mitochondrial protein